MSSPGPAASTLRVDFCGLACLATEVLTFGRSAELILDEDNRYLHGEAGRLSRRGGDWFLHNSGSTLHLQLLHQTGLHAELPPSTNVRLPPGHGRIRLTAGRTTYEIDYFLEAGEGPVELDSHRTGTLFYGRDLTPSQLDYAVTLARHRLQGLRTPPPDQADIARLWGVSTRTVRKTFEDIRARMRDEGVAGIETQEGLLEYLVVNRIVTLDHLQSARLDHPDGPTRRADILASMSQNDDVE